MILSHKHKFIFIKGRKVAGTSIEIALSSICGDEDIITPITPIDEMLRIQLGTPCQNFGIDAGDVRIYLDHLPSSYAACAMPCGPYFNHMSFEQVVCLASELYCDYTYVISERNPYSKVLSGAAFSSFFRQYRSSGTMKSDLNGYKVSIDEYFDKKRFVEPYNFDLYSMHIRKPDFIIKYESLLDDFNLFLKKIGVNHDVNIPHVKKSGVFSLNDVLLYLDENKIRMINSLYKNEFEYFGYSYL